MALHIGGAVISADLTEHEARSTEDGWVVSWLPERVLDRNAAISAVMIAEVCAGPVLSRDYRWLVRDWLAELSLTPDHLRLLGCSPALLDGVAA